MSPTIQLLVRGTKFLTLGALTGSALGLVTFLPGELVATADSASGPTVAWSLAFGVAWVCARVGAVVGLIFFLIRRTLMGEVADPRVITPPSPPAAP